jgi:hypothetical protein
VKKIFITFSAVLFIFFVVFVAGNFNNFQKFISPRFFVSQVVPGPNEAVFEFSPSNGTYNINTVFSVDLRTDSSVGITSVKAYLNFSTSSLQITSLDFTDSVFGSQWEKTFSNTTGKIQIQASAPFPGFTGAGGLIVKINFQSTAVGVANITYDPTSLSLTSADQNVLNLSRSVGASFTLSVSPPSCTNCGLGTPAIFPSGLTANQSFTITCSANASDYDCISAYVNNVSCSYYQWSGNSAIFNCSGRAAGVYTAKCVSKTGTVNNCCVDEKTNSFTVSSSGGGGGGGGAGGGGTTATTTPTGGTSTTTLTKKLIGDLNNDGKVDIYDLSIILSNWKKSVAQYDLSGNGLVDIYDLSIVLSNWGKKI